MWCKTCLWLWLCSVQQQTCLHYDCDTCAYKSKQKHTAVLITLYASVWDQHVLHLNTCEYVHNEYHSTYILISKPIHTVASWYSICIRQVNIQIQANMCNAYPYKRPILVHVIHTIHTVTNLNACQYSTYKDILIPTTWNWLNLLQNSPAIWLDIGLWQWLGR